MIRLPRPERLDPQVDHLIKQATSVQSARRPSPHKARVEMRASSFPICPRAYHVYRRLPPAKRPFDEESFVSESATLQGTALHMVLQRWFGLKAPDHCYGNWVCPRCRKIRRHATGTQYCYICQGEMLYEEYAVDRIGDILFTGHIDMILTLAAYNILLDFKGSSMKKIRGYRSAGAPKPENYLQTNAYSCAINSGLLDFGHIKKIDKIVILYVDRAEPWRNQHAFQMPVSDRVYRESTGLLQTALQSLETMQVPKGICINPQDSFGKWCRWRDICWSPMIETLLDDEVYPEDLRPQDRTAENHLILKTGVT